MKVLKCVGARKLSLVCVLRKFLLWHARVILSIPQTESQLTQPLTYDTSSRHAQLSSLRLPTFSYLWINHAFKVANTKFLPRVPDVTITELLRLPEPSVWSNASRFLASPKKGMGLLIFAWPKAVVFSMDLMYCPGTGAMLFLRFSTKCKERALCATSYPLLEGTEKWIALIHSNIRTNCRIIISPSI